MTEEQKYQAMKNRLGSDQEFTKLQIASARQIFMSKIGEWLIDFLWWTLGKLFSWGRVLVWPIMLYLESKGYINLSDGILKGIKELIK